VKSWIYFARHGAAGPIKIGRAADPHKRVRDLAVGSPIALVLLGAVLSDRPEEEEVEIHTRLSEHCIRGEWFVAAAALQEMKRLEMRVIFPEELKSRETPNDVLDTQMNFRALPEEIEAWKGAARRAGMPLSRWARSQLDAAAGEA
jgi:hypothetical protein